MNTRDLAEYLSGRSSLTEGNYSSGGASNAGLPPLWTGRQERMQQCWRDMMVKLEALFLDVLDASEVVYAECLPILKDLRSSSGDDSWENLPRFRTLLAILTRQAPQGDHWARYAAHMQELTDDLEWVCDQLAPKDTTVPEKPPKDKEDWQAEKDADIAGMPPPVKTFKPANESKEKAPALPPFCPSLVMASLGRAAGLAEASGKAPAFRQAGDAIRLCLETYTDVTSACVDEGLTIPGGNPRLDVVCEWGGTVGKASLHWNNGLVIEGSDTRAIGAKDPVTDKDIAEAVYHCLNTKIDLSPRRVWEAARVVPELYRLIERARSGEIIPRYRFEEALDALSVRLGLNESVRLTPDQLTLHALDESTETMYYFFWDWEQRYGEPAFEGDPDDGEPLHESPLRTRFETGKLLINLESGRVALVNQDGEEEELNPSTTDEDAAARLLSIGLQKESFWKLPDPEWVGDFRNSLNEAGAHPPVPPGTPKKFDSPKLISIEDTRIWDPDLGTYVPGSEREMFCQRCDRKHAIVWTVRDEYGRTWLVGSGCGKKLWLDGWTPGDESHLKSLERELKKKLKDEHEAQEKKFCEDHAAAIVSYAKTKRWPGYVVVPKPGDLTSLKTKDGKASNKVWRDNEPMSTWVKGLYEKWLDALIGEKLGTLKVKDQNKQSRIARYARYELNKTIPSTIREDAAEDEEYQIAQMGPAEAEDDPLEAFEPEMVVSESLDDEFGLWERISDEMLIDEAMTAIAFDPSRHPRDDEGKFIDVKGASKSQKGAAKNAARRRAKERGHKPMTSKDLEAEVDKKKIAAKGIKSVKGPEKKEEPKAAYPANRAAKRAAKKAKKDRSLKDIPAATKPGEPIPTKRELPKGAVEQPADDKTGEVNPQGYAGWNQETPAPESPKGADAAEKPAPELKKAAKTATAEPPEVAKVPDKYPPSPEDVPDQGQAAPEPDQNIPDQGQSGAVEEPGPADSGTPAPEQSTTPQEPPQSFEPRKKEPPPKVAPKPQKSNVSRFNPELDAAFGMPQEQPPEPKRPQVPEPPSQPVDIQGAPAEEPDQQKQPDVTAQAPEAPRPAPQAPPQGYEDLAEPVSPQFQPAYRRPPEELGNMSEEEFQAVRDYVYAQADQALATGNWDQASPEVQNVRKQAERDVEDSIREMQQAAKEAGEEFQGMAPEEQEAAVREKMRSRLEDLSDKLFQRASSRKDELSDLEKEYSEKIVGFLASLTGQTWQEFQNIYYTWRGQAGYES